MHDAGVIDAAWAPALSAGTPPETLAACAATTPWTTETTGRTGIGWCATYCIAALPHRHRTRSTGSSGLRHTEALGIDTFVVRNGKIVTRRLRGRSRRHLELSDVAMTGRGWHSSCHPRYWISPEPGRARPAKVLRLVLLRDACSERVAPHDPRSAWTPLVKRRRCL